MNVAASPDQSLPASGRAAPPFVAQDAALPVVELREVRRIYYKPDGSVLVEALRGVSLAIPKGQYVAIMGASGSGKSTMMNLLGCLDRPTSGAYLLDGQDVSGMTDDEVSVFRGHKIGFIFQAFNLIPELTVRENVEVPLFYQGIHAKIRHTRAVETLNTVGLGDRLGHRPSELSGGQQQRCAIARALVTSPVVLMADEPTGNLDSATGRAVLRLFGDLHAQGKTIIMVTHDPDVAKLCQRVVRLRDGVIETDILQTPASVADEALAGRIGVHG
ncbi:ABC transporter ATP-binding protein [soil metagenome]